ncbi:AAA family ATPase [Hymenobacter sp. BT683]|uniref:AAA family ATPase n=1 Tax=Hymenobacter jeongseonensis TaxID=2791027 RepID=A0ABS0IMD1_9BACT|nr:AAA family ATPase [Hymenobacter jeongseonensis]MBF9239529.1 AAA family ATPase [Hymenobacter jeongseonensis]
MNIQQSSRTRCRIRLLLQGPSGSGKSLGSLLIASGLTAGHWPNIVVIDTEYGSSHLYAEQGPYRVLTLEAPHTPERYIQAIEACEAAGAEVIILDSLTHEWENLLDYHANLPGNSFTAWSKVTPRHNALISRMLTSSAHVIATVRAKTEYVLADKNGKQVPEKVGMKAIQRDGLDYEFDLVLELDRAYNATATKDRTRLFAGQLPFRPGSATGEALLGWCQAGTEPPLPPTPTASQQLVSECESLAALAELYYTLTPELQAALKPDFQQRKHQLLTLPITQFSSSQTQSQYHGNLPHAA